MFPIPISPKLLMLGGVAALVVLILTLTYCAGGSNEKGKQARETVKVQQKIGKADDHAADLRVEDKARIIRENQELTNAIENANGPDDLRRRRGCVILRQQLTPGGRLPAACGPEGR